MTSPVDICNMALAHIRAGNINSLTEASTQAFYCKLFYDICRDQCLEDASWGFNTRISPLALLDSSLFAVFNYACVYQYPSDCIRIERLVRDFEEITPGNSASNRVYPIPGYPVQDFNTPVPYEIFDINGTTVIGANESDLRVKYATKTTDVNKFSSAFKLALSRLLASNIAVAIAGEEKGDKLMNKQLSLYQKLINNAVTNELNQRHTVVPDSEFITVRN